LNLCAASHSPPAFPSLFHPPPASKRFPTSAARAGLLVRIFGILDAPDLTVGFHLHHGRIPPTVESDLIIFACSDDGELLRFFQAVIPWTLLRICLIMYLYQPPLVFPPCFQSPCGLDHSLRFLFLRSIKDYLSRGTLKGLIPRFFPRSVTPFSSFPLMATG